MSDEGWSLSLELRDPTLSYERFEEICIFLGSVHTEVRFAIGDAILLGEKLFGERAYQAFEYLNVSEEGMREFARVAQRVPRSLRRKDLSWSHHRAVAALPSYEEKKTWLKIAADMRLSHHNLRDALRNGAPKSPGVCRCCGRSLGEGE